MRATVLGCGSSGGVPRIGDRWGECNPDNPKNRRRRCSLLVQRSGPDGQTQVLIDTGPDMVPQLLDAGVSVLDAVVWTHPHADHVHGIDDLRQVVLNRGTMLPGYADDFTTQSLIERFGYVFETPEGSNYPPIVNLHLIDGPVVVDGAGGQIVLTPFAVDHGGIPALGFRIGSDDSGSLVYLPDVLTIPDEAWPAIMDADVFICDGLRRTPHPSHANLSQAVDWIKQSCAARGVITNMHIDLDYDDVMGETPDHIVPAFDGMEIEF